MIVSGIRLYEMLKQRIGEKEAESFVEILETRVESKINKKNSILATKEDIGILERRISEVKVEIIRWVVGTEMGIAGIIIAAMKLF